MTQTKEISISKVQLQSPFFKILYDEYDKYIKARNLVIKGKGTYQLCVKEYFYWLEQNGTTKLKEINSSMMVDYYEYISTRPNKRKEGTLSQSMINQHLFSLRMLTDYLLETNQIQKAVTIPKNNIGEKKERESITQKEADLMYKNCADKREVALFLIAYACGLRRTEIQALNTNDLNFSNGILVVKEGKLNKRRDVPMSDNIIKGLKDYLMYERPNYLKESNHLELSFFINNKGKRMDGGHMNEIIKEIIERTKENELQNKEITLHTLRHSIAMHLLENGADMEFIRDYLGHEEIDTTHIYARKNKQRHNTIRR